MMAADGYRDTDLFLLQVCIPNLTHNLHHVKLTLFLLTFICLYLGGSAKNLKINNSNYGQDKLKIQPHPV